ncbi:hypothetical protein A2U01_0111610, partial [Trifolium medium]|nr:hypothetical protein [Trifolium medium]
MASRHHHLSLAPGSVFSGGFWWFRALFRLVFAAGVFVLFVCWCCSWAWLGSARVLFG